MMPTTRNTADQPLPGPWEKITSGRERDALAPLFSGMNSSLVETFMQGHGGTAYADNAKKPRCGLIFCQDFMLLGGDPACEGAGRLAASLPESGHSELHVAASDRAWLSLLERTHPGRTLAYSRYSMARDPACFDRPILRRFASSLPEDCRLSAPDQALYEQAMAQEWSRDFCSFFQNGNDFITRGLGMFVMRRDELVSGASSYSIYNGGIEIQIQTRDDQQRKGFARACAAALILECLERRLFPCWDAMNPPSLKLALSLGYALKHAYPALLLRLQEPPPPSAQKRARPRLQKPLPADAKKT